MAEETDEQLEALARTAMGNRLRADGMEAYRDGSHEFRGASLIQMDDLKQRQIRRQSGRALLIKPLS